MMNPLATVEPPELLSDDAVTRKIEVALLKRLADDLRKDFNDEPSVLLELLDSGRLEEEFPAIEYEEAAPVRRSFSEAIARSNNAQLHMTTRINRIVVLLRALDLGAAEAIRTEPIIDRLEKDVNDLRLWISVAT